jgi:hypothetical protein
MDNRRKDQDSARYEFNRGLSKTYAGYGSPFIFGWGTCVRINAKVWNE